MVKFYTPRTSLTTKFQDGDGTRKKVYSATLLIFTISSECLDKENFAVYTTAITLAATTATRRLCVYLIHPVLACPPEQRAENWTKVQTLSTYVYSICVFASPSADITVLYHGWSSITMFHCHFLRSQEFCLLEGYPTIPRKKEKLARHTRSWPEGTTSFST